MSQIFQAQHGAFWGVGLTARPWRVETRYTLGSAVLALHIDDCAR